MLTGAEKRWLLTRLALLGAIGFGLLIFAQFPLGRQVLSYLYMNSWIVYLALALIIIMNAQWKLWRDRRRSRHNS
jgi:hypothetical protein